MELVNVLEKIATTDIFERSSGQLKTGIFIGRPFYLDYNTGYLLIADAWKKKCGGIPQGAFLLAYYEDEEDVDEAILLRVLKPTKLPTDSDIISSMIEYYKDNLKTTGKESDLDTFTRYEFSFSGLECRVLGTFYRSNGETRFGADVENFYSAHHYSVIKPNVKVLELIANFRERGITGRPSDIRIGSVRYSSTTRFQSYESEVPVFVSAIDFIGKRTALFGMTRTGKSNTVKKIIQATVSMSENAANVLDQGEKEKTPALLEPFSANGIPKYPVGQIIFDINGEYANANLQDEGTAIFELFKDRVIRYSVLEKPGFKVMKVNFYKDVISGFELICSALEMDTADYVKSFLSIDLTEPEDATDFGAKTRFERKKAAYLACLYRAGFKPPDNFKVKFSGEKELNELVGGLDPKKGITIEEAADWFTGIWDSQTDEYFEDYKRKKGKPWVDEDLKAVLIFLTKKKQPNGAANISGFIKLRSIADQHTASDDKPFKEEILGELRKGSIVIVDLSQGNPELQRMYSEYICRRIFQDSMERFVKNNPNNFIQFYFEEAHNLFPKKEDKDLSQIYNRIAKEGAKLNLGLIYLTQEVSSISSNILKNTQNWFIAHLNNDDETKEIKKYYDFGDFSESLVRFSASTDKGFVRMKTYSNPFVVPVQVDRFLGNGT